MPIPNAASRIHACLARVGDVPGALTEVEGFAIVLQVRRESDAQGALYRLRLLDEQITEVERVTGAIGIPTHLFEQQLAKVRGTLRNAQPDSTFQSVRDAIGADVFMAFAWLSHVLPSESDESVHPTIRGQLLQSLQEARVELAATYLPSVLRLFATRHLESFMLALEHYDLTGAAPLKKAIAEMASDVVVMDRTAMSSFASVSEHSKAAWNKSLRALGETVDAAGEARLSVGAIDDVDTTTSSTALTAFVRAVLRSIRRS
jgi:hypothetical protein